MSDIVERLRFCGTELDGHYGQASIFGEAADEIARLRNELANEVDLGEMRLAEIERLRDRALKEKAE